MLRIGVLQHFWCETAGVFGEVLAGAGFQVVPVRLYAGEALPSPDAFDGWLVMGGPMNVDEERQHAFLGPERQLLGELIRRDVPVVGVCLGAQLLARAAGARVYAKRPKEIGLFSVEMTSDGGRDVLFERLGDQLEVFQWHGDTFDLPPGAVHLARSERFEQQAFRLGRHVYGLQFHLECTSEIVGNLLQACPQDLRELPHEEDFRQAPEGFRDALARQNDLAERVIRRWMRFLNC